MTHKLTGWVEFKTPDERAVYYRVERIQAVYEMTKPGIVVIELIGDSDECCRHVKGTLLEVMQNIWSVE